MKTFIYILLTLRAMCTYNPGEIHSELDPGRITWWQENWSPGPISPDSNFAREVTALTFNLRLGNPLDLKGVFVISFPTGVNYKGHSGTVTIPADKSYPGNSDFELTINDVSIPESGVYGPFEIRTRAYSDGATLDLSTAFGSITIVPSVAIGTLAIFDASGSSSVTIGAVVDLNFKFILETDLLEFDTLTFSVGTLLTLNEDAKCYSETINSENHLCAASESSCILPCSVNSEEENQFVLINWGTMKVDYLGTGFWVKIRITDFTLPLAVYETETESAGWHLVVERVQENKRIAEYSSITGPSYNMKPGGVTATWELKSEFIEPTAVQVGIALFTEVYASLEHGIPSPDTYLSMKFKGVTISGDWWADLSGSNGSGSLCYSALATSCTVISADEVELKFTSNLLSGTTVDVLMYTRFDALNPEISAIETGVAGQLIDSLSAAIVMPIETFLETRKLSEFTVFPSFDLRGNVVDERDYYSNTGLVIFFEFLPGASDWAGPKYFSLSCPLQLTEPGLKK